MKRKPHICILTSQYFDWGIYGGFGSMSRKLAESLVYAGYQVSVIVPRRNGQKPVEDIQGVAVQSFAPLNISEACRLLRNSPADVFHSQDPTLLTYFAQKLLPSRVHLVTCRDPRNWKDWLTEFRYATSLRRALLPFNYVTESGPLVGQSVRNAHGVFCPAHCLKHKIKQLYGLNDQPDLLPNLIDVPRSIPRKSDIPTITFIARFDKRKRPWIFMELARQFPQYRFIAVGKGSASAEGGYDVTLRKRYGRVENLVMPGLINRFTEPERLHEILSDTWVFVSTAAREGLPLSFLEASAYGCAILSAVDPDQFATRFGGLVRDDDFASGLQTLLTDSPLKKGRAAYQYVRTTYETGKALTAHTDRYEACWGP